MRIEIKNANFSWEFPSQNQKKEQKEEEVELNSSLGSQKAEDFQLKNINMSIDKKGIYFVIGETGSGKSSLLSSILKETNCIKGTLKTQGKIAYIPQISFIMNQTPNPKPQKSNFI